MFEIAGKSMNKVIEAFPEHRFKYIRLNASQILNIMQGFSEYKTGDIINLPLVQFPPGTKVLNIMPDDWNFGSTDSWRFLLYNDAWESVNVNDKIPYFEYETAQVHVFKRR